MKELVEQLAERSTTGDLYVALAEIYLSEQEWGLAFQAFHEGLNKGKLSNQKAAEELYTEIASSLGLSNVLTTEEGLAR